jgi:hypothetical protein
MRWIAMGLALVSGAVACGASDDAGDDASEPTATSVATVVDTMPATAGDTSPASTAGDAASDDATGSPPATDGGGLCADFGELCFDDDMGGDNPFMFPCCEPTAQCAMSCTDSEPPHCIGQCQPGMGG